MNPQPIAPLLVLGGLAEPWGQSLSPKKAYSIETQTRKSEARIYQFLFYPGLAEFRGVVVLLSFREWLSPQQKALLLFASRYTKELAVIFCDTKNRSTEDRDTKEKNFRELLEELGFQANLALFFYEPKKLPSEETLSAMMSALDPRDLEKGQPFREAPPPDNLDKLRAELYQLCREFAFFATKLQPVKARSPQEPDIITRFGGMPYLEQGEDWPTCERCKRTICFLFQINAAQDLQPTIKGAGLFTFYSCGNYEHYEEEPQIIARHYAAPSVEKAQPQRAETSLRFASTRKTATMCSVKRSAELQGPLLQELEQADGPRQARLLRLLNAFAGTEPERLDYEGVYSQAMRTIGATPAQRFIFDGELDPQIGGHIDPRPERASPRCVRCDNTMRALAHIHGVKGLAIPFREKAIRMYICPCSPTHVRISFRKESDSERYQRETE